MDADFALDVARMRVEFRPDWSCPILYERQIEIKSVELQSGDDSQTPWLTSVVWKSSLTLAQTNLVRDTAHVNPPGLHFQTQFSLVSFSSTQPGIRLQ